MKLSTHNSQRPGSPADLKGAPDLTVLDAQGYFVYPVKAVRVLNADPWARYADHALAHEPLGSGGFDVVLSGPDTTLQPGKWPHPPVGPVMRSGHLDTEGTRGHFRGLVAVLEDGTIIVERANGASGTDLRSHLSEPGNPLRDVCGGGALLIEQGRMVSSVDLKRAQLYGGDPGGIYSKAMAPGSHVIFGIRKGQAIAAMCWSRSGAQIQEDFLSMGFTSLVKLASGSAVVLRDQVYAVTGTNAVGLGIMRRR